MTYSPSPHTGRSIRYRPRPSSALQAGATLANLPIGSSRYQGTAPGSMFRMWNFLADPALPESQQRFDWGSQPGQNAAPSYAWRTPSPHTGRSAINPGQDNQSGWKPDYQSAMDSAYAGWEAAMADANGDMEYLRAQRELQLQEQELRRALLDGDLERARQLLKDIEANKKALAASYDKYANTINPYYDKAVESGKEAGAAAQAAVGENTAAQEAAQAAIADQAAGDVQSFGEKIGNSEAGIAAAQELAGVGLSEYAKLQGVLAAGALEVSKAQQQAATLGPEGDRAWTIHQAAAREKQAMADFDQRADAAADQITDLEMQRKLFDIQVQQSDLAHARAMEEAGKTVHMDAIGFGRESAAEYLYERAAALGLDPTRTQALLSIWEQAYSEGVYDRSSWDSWSAVTYDPKTGQPTSSPWGGPFQPTVQEQKIMAEMFDAYQRGSQAWQDGSARPASSTSISAWTGGHSSSGTPSNNQQVGASAHSPESGQFYQRQQWVGSMIRTWESMFNVRSAGQWRQTGGPCGGKTGRSCNSDHYTGGAVDFKGSRSAMLKAYNYFKNHPAVAYVLFENNAAHMDHVHVSFKINYAY